MSTPSPSNWLDDAALAYIPPVGSDDWVEVFRRGNVAVFIGSVQMLLAMKLLANRGVRDSNDIGFLLEACGVGSLADAQEIYGSYHAQDVLSATAAARVLDWLERRPAAWRCRRCRGLTLAAQAPHAP